MVSYSCVLGAVQLHFFPLFLIQCMDEQRQFCSGRILLEMLDPPTDLGNVRINERKKKTEN